MGLCGILVMLIKRGGDLVVLCEVVDCFTFMVQ